MIENYLGQDELTPRIQHWLEANACALSSVTFTIASADMEGNGPLNWTQTVDRVDWQSSYGFSGAGRTSPTTNKFCVIRSGFHQWSYPVGLTDASIPRTDMPFLVGSGTTVPLTPPEPISSMNGIFGCTDIVSVGGVSYIVSIILIRADLSKWEFVWYGTVHRSGTPPVIIEEATISEGRISPSTLLTLNGGTETSTGTYPTDFTVAVTY